MKTWSPTRELALALCGALAMAGCASSKATAPAAPPAVSARPPGGKLSERVVTATARVKSLDLAQRMVTLERADGSLVTFHADEQVRNLAQVRVGDVVRATYYESIAFAVQRHGEGKLGASVAEGATRAQPGEKPGAAGARVTTITARITAIDKAAGTVTLEGPGGHTTTVAARDPSNLDLVQVGDLVDIMLTEAVGIAVEARKQ